MAEDPPLRMVCPCGRIWTSMWAYRQHVGRYCIGAPQQDALPTEHEDREPQPEPAPDPLGEGMRQSLFSTAFKYLTRLRLKFNASNVLVQAVKDMVREMRATELRYLAAHSADYEQLSSLVAVDPFQNLNSAYMEARARDRLLPDLSPSQRVLGQRFEAEELNDGRTVNRVIEDVSWDYDVLNHIEAMLEARPALCTDFFSFRDRLQQSGNVISDVWDGVAARSNPLFLAATASGNYPLMLQYYMDGIGLTGPLAIAAARNKAAASYVSLLNFSPVNRTSEHCIIPVGLCHEKDWSRYPEVDIVCGPFDEPENGTSLGAQMRRLGTGAELRIPEAFSSYPGVRWLEASPATRERSGYFLRCQGGIMLAAVDSPAAGHILGTKIAFGPSTVGICRACYCKQIDGSNHRAHCQPNSFLPWVRASGSAYSTGAFAGLVCTDAAMSSSYNPDFMGALQEFELRTVESSIRDMGVCKLLQPTDQEYFLQQIGIRKFDHALSRLPFFLFIQAPMDFMHVELLGNIANHLGKLLWKWVRELGWMTIPQYNLRVRSFPGWARGVRKSMYVLGDDALAGPMDGCAVGSLWTAHHTLLFMCFSVELLHVFVPEDQQDHPTWQCWLHHYRYVTLCLQRHFTFDDIRSLDIAIYEKQALFLLTYGNSAWFPKDNFAQHFAMDILRWGPLRTTWCMMFEHMNQVLKFSALRTNFANTLMTAATRLSQSLAFELFCASQNDFLNVTFQIRLAETCTLGTSPTVDALAARGLVAFDRTTGTINVNWLTKAKIGSSAFVVNDLVLVSLTSPLGTTRENYLAQILDLVAIGPQTFVQIILIIAGTASGPPKVTWQQLRTAARASLEQCIFVETSALSLTLLHPVSRPDRPSDVSFVSW